MTYQPAWNYELHHTNSIMLKIFKVHSKRQNTVMKIILFLWVLAPHGLVHRYTNFSEKQTVSIFGAEESVPIQEKTHRREFRKALQQRRSKLDSVCSVKKYSVCNENTSFESGLWGFRFKVWFLRGFILYENELQVCITRYYTYCSVRSLFFACNDSTTTRKNKPISGV